MYSKKKNRKIKQYRSQCKKKQQCVQNMLSGRKQQMPEM